MVALSAAGAGEYGLAGVLLGAAEVRLPGRHDHRARGPVLRLLRGGRLLGGFQGRFPDGAQVPAPVRAGVKAWVGKSAPIPLSLRLCRGARPWARAPRL